MWVDGSTAANMTPTTVWWLDRTDDAEPFRLGELLGAEERRRHDQYRQEVDRDRFLLGRVLARLALAALTRTPPESIMFRTSPFGRPVWVERETNGPWFNIAHGGALVVVAVTEQSDRIGIDVEPEERSFGIDDLLDIACHPTERAWLRGLTADARHVAFLRLWTLKEALLKATGLGLRGDPSRQAFTLGEPPKASSLDLPAGNCLNQWRFRQWQVRRDHNVALAVQGSGQAEILLRHAGELEHHA